jgi:hypothetical protein
MSRHGAYKRYLFTYEQGELKWLHITLTRTICRSCKTTHALLPADIIAYCQYSLLALVSIFIAVIIKGVSVPKTAQSKALPVTSVYKVMDRFRLCHDKLDLLLREHGGQPADDKAFTETEALRAILEQRRLLYHYWYHNRRYLWQSRFQNTPSPSVTMGWLKLGPAGFT